MGAMQCSVCGQSFEAKRASARFCGATCRQRAHRAPHQRPMKQAPTAPGPTPVVAVELPTEVGSVVEVTRRQLVDAGRLDTPLGQAALVAARRLDAPHMESGGGVASLIRALAQALDKALEGAQQAADLVDELRVRRDAKRAAG